METTKAKKPPFNPKDHSSAVNAIVMEPKRHHLKTWPEYFKAILRGKKKFEVRKDDRNFKVGDLLYLEEWEPKIGRYTDRDFVVKVTYKLKGGSFGIEKGYCVLGIAEVP